jgi:hypothetical protein
MANFTESPILTDRYSKAISLALQWHRYQIRKQGTPYVSHLLQVSGLVLEHGGTEDEAIAAVLHDAVEDVDIPIQQIQGLFGRNVANIVNAVSEDKTLPKEQRKEDYVFSISRSDRSVALVSAADKLHNLRCYANQPDLITVDVCLFYCKLIPEYTLALTRKHLIVKEMKDILLDKILPAVSLYWVVGSQGETIVLEVGDLKQCDIGDIKAIAA